MYSSEYFICYNPTLVFWALTPVTLLFSPILIIFNSKGRQTCQVEDHCKNTRSCWSNSGTTVCRDLQEVVGEETPKEAASLPSSPRKTGAPLLNQCLHPWEGYYPLIDSFNFYSTDLPDRQVSQGSLFCSLCYVLQLGVIDLNRTWIISGQSICRPRI